jgi:hypothetical protein
MKLDLLFRSWHETFRKAEDSSGMIIRDFSADDMCFDGFYPGYLKQRVKTLFIGKESREISGYNYLELLYKAIKVGRIGKKSLNRSEFHRRMLYLAYYLQTGESDYSEIPFAQELSLLFGTDKLSFAFMNLSKFSNENVNYQADYELIGKSVDLSTKGRNYLQEEVNILAPDLIFTMNLRDILSSLGTLKPIKGKKYERHLIRPYRLNVRNKEVLLLDTCHFSKIVREQEYFFDPIVDILRNKWVLRAVSPFYGLSS